MFFRIWFGNRLEIVWEAFPGAFLLTWPKLKVQFFKLEKWRLKSKGVLKLRSL